MGHGSIIYDRTEFAGDLLSNPAAIDGGLLAVEVGFQAMTDRFMEPDSSPGVIDDHRHCTGRRIGGPKLYTSLSDRFHGHTLWRTPLKKLQSDPPASAVKGHLRFVAL